MKMAATSVESYLAVLPSDRRAALAAVRAAILRNLPEGFVECFQCGMISYAIPLARFPDTYNGQPLAIAGLGAQKNHLAVYLMCIYGDTKVRQWFEAEYRKSGKKLDAGKACIRFKTLDDLPVELIGRVIARCSVEELIRWHDMAQSQRPHRRAGTSKSKKEASRPAKADR
jgi:uncharacterized protein YdhG (YjbR/CyaY superfamily)